MVVYIRFVQDWGRQLFIMDKVGTSEATLFPKGLQQSKLVYVCWGCVYHFLQWCSHR